MLFFLQLINLGSPFHVDVVRYTTRNVRLHLLLIFNATDTETHSPAEQALTKPTSTKPKTHTSTDQGPSTSEEDQKPYTMVDGHDLRGLVPSRMGSSDSPSSGSTTHTRYHSCTDAGHQGSCLTQQSLAQLQAQLSLYHTDAKATPGCQETKHKHDAEAAQSVGSDLPMSLAEEFTAMTPMERYQEEQKYGMDPWTILSRRH
jgi:hypothetical protein